jgi:hypothetical protein
MGVDTEVFINLPHVKISDSFFDKIDHCFKKVGFERYGGEGDADFQVMFYVPEMDDCVFVDWSERDQIQSRGSVLTLDYSINKNTIWNFMIRYSENMITDHVTILAMQTIFYCYDYSEIFKDLLLRFQFVSREIHRTFNAIRTEAIQELHEGESLFCFSEDEWRTVGDLPLEKCEAPHLRLWAANPEKPLARDYYGEEGLCPKSGNLWKPKVPVAYDSRYGEFHLLFTDKSGVEKISLLRNCLCCGGLLPESERDNLFGRPLEKEEKKFREAAWRAKSAEEIIGIFGKPDLFLGSVAYAGNNTDEGIREQLVYTDLSDNAVVIFKEFEMGMIIVNYAGKWQGGKDD